MVHYRKLKKTLGEGDAVVGTKELTLDTEIIDEMEYKGSEGPSTVG